MEAVRGEEKKEERDEAERSHLSNRKWEEKKIRVKSP